VLRTRPTDENSEDTVKLMGSGIKEKRVCRVYLRFTNPEYEELKLEVKKLKIKLSEYARRMVLGRPVITRIDAESIAELRRQGGLLKHYFNETGGQNSYLTEVILKDIQAIVRRLQDDLWRKKQN